MDFSAISFSTGNAGSLTLTRFSDGLYARIEDDKSVKEMYQLPNGIYLFKGYDPSKREGPSPFFMLDMPAVIILNFLAGYFPQPCAVPTTPTWFSYSNSTMSKTTISVSGNIHLDSQSSLAFDLLGVEQQKQGAAIKASGTIKFLDISPVPPDTTVSGWVISRGIGERAEIVEGQPTVSTFKDLGKLTQGSPKQ